MAHAVIDFGPLLALTAFLSLAQSVYSGAGESPPGSWDRFVVAGNELAVVAWVVADARRRRCVPCFDFGFLIVVFFPLSLVWYVFWTRGWKGFVPLTALFGLMTLPGIVYVVVWACLRPGA